MVNCWFGSWWFGYLGYHYERNHYSVAEISFVFVTQLHKLAKLKMDISCYWRRRLPLCAMVAPFVSRECQHGQHFQRQRDCKRVH